MPAFEIPVYEYLHFISILFFLFKQVILFLAYPDIGCYGFKEQAGVVQMGCRSRRSGWQQDYFPDGKRSSTGSHPVFLKKWREACFLPITVQDIHERK